MDGKIMENIDLDGLNVEKIKLNFQANLLILLMNGNTMAIYKNRKLINTIQIATKSDKGNKFLFINDASHFKQIHSPKESISKTLVLFDLLNFDLVEVNISKLDNIQLKSTKLIDKTNPNVIDQFQDHLVIVYRELNMILFIEKFLKKFSFVSYKKQSLKNSTESNTIRYLNYQDEKVIQKFWNTFANYPHFKYKVWKIKNLDIYFSISILKRENESDPKSLIKKVHSTLIVHARLVKSSNRKNDNSIEIEIVQVYAFCKRFHFFEDENSNSKDMILCAYYTNYLISTYDSNDGRLLLINISQNKELFNLDLNTISNPKIKNLCVDSNIEYIVFNDRNKLLWLFRIKDAKQLGCLPLYGFVNEIKFNKDNRYVCLNMNDRRIFNLLIVDPDRDEHRNRIKELSSRKILDLPAKVKEPKERENEFVHDSNSEKDEENAFEMLAEDSSGSSDDDIFSSDEDTTDKDAKNNHQKESNANKEIKIDFLPVSTYRSRKI